MSAPAENRMQAKTRDARERLDAWTREMMEWHFNPETGCPFWLERAKSLPFDPRREVGDRGALVAEGDFARAAAEYAAFELGFADLAEPGAAVIHGVDRRERRDDVGEGVGCACSRSRPGRSPSRPKLTSPTSDGIPVPLIDIERVLG